MAGKKKVNELPDFEKDVTTNAVINTNTTAFSNRRDQLAKLEQKNTEMEMMKKDIAEIKELLKGLSKK